MNYMIQFIRIAFLIALTGCSEDPVTIPEADLEPKLTALTVDFEGSAFETVITGNSIEMKRQFPSRASSVSIGLIELSKNTTADLKSGDALNFTGSDIKITITNSLSKRTAEYTLKLSRKEPGTIVEKHGLLKTSGNKIKDKNGEVVSLAGNSFFWSNTGWGGEKFYNSSAVSWLVLDWDTQVIRAAIGVDDPGGYIQYKNANKARAVSLIDAAISNGIYVIIDWHSHHAENYQAEAIEFFTEMATLYGSYDNVIYEIYNEPLKVSWSSVIKPYAEAVISAIRSKDPDNLIVVGTPEWSQQVDKPAADPITTSDNIAYSLHFYTKNHQQWLRDRATAALAAGIPLFVTEWGSLGYTTADPETDKWMEWCRLNKISHCNWAVNDKAEEWSVVPVGANITGNWTQLTAAGMLAREIIRYWQ